MYKYEGKELQVLLAHPGGPFWAKKEWASWSIPKGEFEETEEPLNAALREMTEETGLTPSGKFIELSPVKLKSGKIIYAFAVEGSADPSKHVSNNFDMEWPPKSGKKQSFPEVDRIEWFNVEEAMKRIIEGQKVIIEELSGLLDTDTK